MFLQILPGHILPVRMPDTESGTLEGRLRVRGCLQVRPFLQLQALVSDRYHAAYCALGLGTVRGVTSKPERTLQCHSTKGVHDNSFVQFYPTPPSVAKEAHTQSGVVK